MWCGKEIGSYVYPLLNTAPRRRHAQGSLPAREYSHSENNCLRTGSMYIEKAKAFTNTSSQSFRTDLYFGHRGAVCCKYNFFWKGAMGM